MSDMRIDTRNEKRLDMNVDNILFFLIEIRMEKPLTVGELINELKKFPEDLVVVTPDTEQYERDFNEVFRARTVEAFIDEKK